MPKLGRPAREDQPRGVSIAVDTSRAMDRPANEAGLKARLSPSLDGQLDRGFM